MNIKELHFHEILKRLKKENGINHPLSAKEYIDVHNLSPYILSYRDSYGNVILNYAILYGDRELVDNIFNLSPIYNINENGSSTLHFICLAGDFISLGKYIYKLSNANLIVYKVKEHNIKECFPCINVSPNEALKSKFSSKNKDGLTPINYLNTHFKEGEKLCI